MTHWNVENETETLVRRVVSVVLGQAPEPQPGSILADMVTAVRDKTRIALSG